MHTLNLKVCKTACSESERQVQEAQAQANAERLIREGEPIPDEPFTEDMVYRDQLEKAIEGTKDESDQRFLEKLQEFLQQ